MLSTELGRTIKIVFLLDLYRTGERQTILGISWTIIIALEALWFDTSLSHLPLLERTNSHRGNRGDGAGNGGQTTIMMQGDYK